LSEVAHELVDVAALMDDGPLWRIYETCFPIAEREPRATIRRSLERGGGLVARARLDGETVGMAACQLLAAERWVFLVYLAVAPERRGRTLGSTLFEFVWRMAETQAPGLQGMVWEIDRVADALDVAEAERRARRLRFFGERGGRLLTDQYVQPALDGRSTVPMHLAVRTSGAVGESDAELARRLTRAIYFDKYQCINGISRHHLDDLLAGRFPPAPPFAPI
jgi:GNAT superfamily N-acetyltransferase